MTGQSDSLTPYMKKMAEIDALNAEANRLREMEIGEVIGRIKRDIALYKLTAADLGFDLSSDNNIPLKKQDNRSNVAPKYIGPEGEKWSGRGKTPNWLKVQLDKGKSVDDFLAR